MVLAAAAKANDGQAKSVVGSDDSTVKSSG
jgi:hypothetical protein